MIGVLCKDSEARAVREFFQLFKTPWEHYVPHRSYNVVIASSEEIPQDLNARVLVIYQSHPIGFDEQIGVTGYSRKGNTWVEWDGATFPVYGDSVAVQSFGRPLLKCRETQELLGCILGDSKRPTVRIGFDLFYEVAFLLRQGQPAANAHMPTLDIHVSLLRAIMVTMGVPFVEVPPVPASYDFIGCLTHDVDFIGIRDHKCDRTIGGFLYRCLVSSLLNALRGKLSWSKCRQNWTAALSLPLVYLGIREDFWLEFDRYRQIERDLGSTFFFIPFKNLPGTSGSASASKRRAAKYDITEICEQVLELVKSGCDVSVHGIDAWHNSQSARAELHRIQEITRQAETGIRMHWLYWTESSPKNLEDAGFAYDSTFGYNDAVGFRAGTTQPFCPLGAKRLLELPLNIQDSAMFYSDRMALSEAEALNACKGLIRSMALFGGALTVNWHTRSLSPERLWGDSYAELLEEIQKHRVWFGTAQEIVGWFRKRRGLHFDSVQYEDDRVTVAMSGLLRRSDPAFNVRLYHPRFVSGESKFSVCMPTYTDHQWNGEETMELPYSTSTDTELSKRGCGR